MIIRFTIFVFSLFLFTNNSYSQEMNLKGQVYDSTGTVPLINAVAVAIRVRDSLMLGYERTDAKGFFELSGFEVDTFTLIISHPNYDDKFFYIFGHVENDSINIPTIAMPTKLQDFDDVVIYANKNPIFYNGDTLVYVADSFQVAENAVVEDLLKKLPGLEIGADGKIRSQGKDIDQVLVDGDEFFGSDPTIATKNLGAKGVETVQLYEKKQENSEDGEETLQILDLRLKEDAKKGYFGRVSGASDFQQFYEGELLVNKFNKSQKISIFVLGANTPKSNFGFGDRNKFGLENEGNTRMFDDDGDFIYNSNSSTTGIPQTLRAGIYFSDKIGKKKKTEIGFNYSYYDTKNNALSNSRSQFFIQDSTFTTDDSTRNISSDVSHNVNLRFESQLDSLTRIEIRPSFRSNTGAQNNKDYTTWNTSEELFSRSNIVTNENKATSNSLSTEVEFVRKFMKPKRMIALDYDLGLEDNRSDGQLNSTNIYSDSSQIQSSFDQGKINYQNGVTHSIRGSYYEPIGKKFKIQTEYSYDVGNTNQNKETRDFNPTTGQFDLVNSTFSNNFENVRTQHRAGAKLWYESRKYTIVAGARVRNIDIQNRNKVTEDVINQNITNVLPNLRFTYNPTRSKRLRITYNTNSRQPSISDLQPIPDNTNPNRLRIGNSNLRPDYSHSVNANFNTWNALSGRYIYVGGNGYYATDAFGDSTTITNFGQQIIKKVNVKSASSASVNMGAGLPFKKNKKFTLRPNLSGNIYQGFSFLNGERNTATNLSLTPSLELVYQSDSLEFNVRGNLSYNSPTNSLRSFSTTPYTAQDYFAGFVWRLKHGFKVESNVNYTINGQRSDGYNINYFIWNASVSKYFLKTNNLELQFIANDILNQNIDASRYVSQNVITDNFTKIISRYFLVKMTYRFNSNKTTEKDGKGRWY